jgi:hypothetical protein
MPSQVSCKKQLKGDTAPRFVEGQLAQAKYRIVTPAVSPTDTERGIGARGRGFDLCRPNSVARQVWPVCTVSGFGVYLVSMADRMIQRVSNRMINSSCSNRAMPFARAPRITIRTG